MALALFFVGLVLVITGIKGTQGQLSSLLASEFTGANNFWQFIAGIFFLGALGYYPPLRNTSRLMIALVLVVLILSNGGFWQKLTEAVNNPQRVVAAPKAEVPGAVDVKAAGKDVGDVGGFLGGLASNAVVNAVSGGGLSSVGKVAGGIIGALF